MNALLLAFLAAAVAAATPDYYRELGVPEQASLQQIRKAYKALAKKWHPDVNSAPGATEKFMQVQQAHEVLSDVEKRRDYDYERRHGYAPNQGMPQQQHSHGFHHGQHSGGAEYMLFQGPDGRLYRVRQGGGSGFQHPFGGHPRWGGGYNNGGGDDWLWWFARLLEDPTIMLYGALLMLFIVMLVARNAGPPLERGAQQQDEAAPASDTVDASALEGLPNLAAARSIAPSVPLASAGWMAAHESRMLLLAVIDDGSDAGAVETLLRALQPLMQRLSSDPIAIGICASDAASHANAAVTYQRALARRLHRVTAVDVFESDVVESSPFLTLLRVRVSTGTARATRVLLPPLAFRDMATCTTALQHVCETALGGSLPLHNVTDLLQAILPQPGDASSQNASVPASSSVPRHEGSGIRMIGNSSSAQSAQV